MCSVGLSTSITYNGYSSDGHKATPSAFPLRMLQREATLGTSAPPLAVVIGSNQSRKSFQEAIPRKGHNVSVNS